MLNIIYHSFYNNAFDHIWSSKIEFDFISNCTIIINVFSYIASKFNSGNPSVIKIESNYWKMQ
jgi:hypothetical protein